MAVIVACRLEVCMPNLLYAVSEIMTNYQTASDTLAGFMSYNKESLSKYVKVRRDLAQSVQAIPAEIPVNIVTDDGEKIDLSDDDRRRFAEAMLAHAESVERYPHMMMNMSFIYLVALFDAFLGDMFTAVLTHRPETMKSKEKKLSYERILERTSEGDLISFMARREINDLSYKSVIDQARYYKDKFNIDLGDSGVGVSVLAEIQARRNLFVHNRGVVNQIYLDRVGKSPHHLGEVLNIEHEYWNESRQRLDAVAIYVHKAVVDKFVAKGGTSP
jgi:hypothetical protein